MKKRLSVTLITRNEEARIGAILADIRPFADEIIVVDTGSTDRTREIAQAAGALVSNMAWQDDFALARNTALSKATGDWIFWVDADDRLSKEDGKKLKETIGRAGPRDAFTVEVINTSKDGRPSSFLQLRLFPRAEELRFEGKIHESVAGRAKAAGYTITASDIQVIHTGYETAEARQAKMRRNFALLEKELKKDPGNITLRYLLANTLLLSGRENEALVQLERIANAPDARQKQADVYVRTLTTLSKSEHDAGRYAKAESWARLAADSRPDDMDARLALARALFSRGSLSEAMREVNAGFQMKPYISSISVDFISIRAALYDLAVKILHLSQKHLEAIAILRKGLDELPYSAEMVHMAASYYLELQRYDEAESLYRKAILRIPEAGEEFNGKLRGLKVLRERGSEGPGIHPDYLKQVPAGAAAVLVVGVGGGILGLELKKMGIKRVAGLLLDGDNKDTASVRFDALYSSTDALARSGETFDAALFGDRLSALKYPAEVLSAVRPALKPRSRCIFSFPNFQNYTVLTSLGYGFFNYGDTGILRDGYRRLFTRQSALRYLEEQGFKAEAIHEITDPLFSQQIQHAPHKVVNLGKALLDLEGLSEEAMRDFFVIQYFVTAEKLPKSGEIISALHLPQNLKSGKSRELNAKGTALIAEGKYPEAAECFHQILKEDKNNHEAYSNLGLTEWYSGRYEDAYFLFKKAVDLNPDDEDGYINLWDAARKTGREEDTLSFLKKASEQHPAFPDLRAIVETT